MIDPANPTGYAQVLAEILNSVLDKTYILGDDVIAQAVDDAGTPAIQTLLYDGHGSTRGLLDALGVVLETYAYDAYGNPLGFDIATALTALLYSGEFTDAATGMQYLRARYYNPVTGRFNRVDPLSGNTSDPISLLKYLYKHANPLIGIDPSGEFTLRQMLIVTAIVGILASIYYIHSAGDASLASVPRTVTVTISIDAEGMPGTFDTSKVQQKLQTLISNRVFNTCTRLAVFEGSMGGGLIISA